MFKTNFDTSSDKFQNYYKDVSQRVKDREIDLLIVVNMFLTGFDATTLNTLWVDKNLRFIDGHPEAHILRKDGDYLLDKGDEFLPGLLLCPSSLTGKPRWIGKMMQGNDRFHPPVFQVRDNFTVVLDL